MTLLVEEPGPFLLVQDQGRSGSSHVGVPPSGALHPDALALANRLVGNRPDAAGLEILLGGVRMRAQRPTRIAVTGAQVGVTVAGRPVAWGAAVSVRADELVEISAARDGIRSWLAVAGGVDVPAVLGSRSTDTLTWLGPDPIGPGVRLATGLAVQPSTEVEETDAVATNAVPRARPEVLELPVQLGPREDWFTDAAVELLLRQEYAVDPHSNRTALRLTAEGRLERRRQEELPSEGIVTGAVQVPASGQPLVFLADHPVTGGYPVVGVVSPESLASCAQARPGDRVRFRRSRPRLRRS